MASDDWLTDGINTTRILLQKMEQELESRNKRNSHSELEKMRYRILSQTGISFVHPNEDIPVKHSNLYSNHKEITIMKKENNIYCEQFSLKNLSYLKPMFQLFFEVFPSVHRNNTVDCYMNIYLCIDPEFDNRTQFEGIKIRHFLVLYLMNNGALFTGIVVFKPAKILNECFCKYYDTIETNGQDCECHDMKEGRPAVPSVNVKASAYIPLY